MNWKKRYNGFKKGDRVKFIKTDNAIRIKGQIEFSMTCFSIGNVVKIFNISENGYILLKNSKTEYNKDCFEKVVK